SKEAVNKTNMIQKKYEDNANTVQYSPKLKLYADKFIDTYMNISKDSKELESREKELLKYFPSDYKKPEEKTSDTERKLNSKEFYNIKRKDKQTIIQYIVNYDVNITEKKEVKVKKKKKNDKDKDEYETKTEEKQRKVNQNILINIPIKSENNKYVVVEYPYFTPIPDSQLNKAKMVEDNLKDNKREDNPKAKAFIEDFFNKYSSSKSDDMAYLMDNPEGLEGTREVSQIREI
ncbi:TPA: conjugal transfer protein, partial [Staphylococcus aureus]|nr:conjugal transfer protein [Staphylococcus aureus]HCG2863488.1 conjugal transfer protein [Staphylococcus aureus]HCZ0994605.1 conjugal transfer protein [Staphylococcus aureus]HCZ1005479.1 conjugal transfer protein [Staphylococcus aureus]HDA8736545.1 conjugal transfer protein [Staphylococcus aureus]